MLPDICDQASIDTQHSGVSQFYDVPTISVRNPFLYDVLADTKMVKEFFVTGSDDHSNDTPKLGNTDLRHVSTLFSVGRHLGGDRADDRCRIKAIGGWESWSRLISIGKYVKWVIFRLAIRMSCTLFRLYLGYVTSAPM
jgi:hypothetical protein